MIPVSDYGIIEKEDGRPDCPLCKEANQISLVDMGETKAFYCVSCGETGNTITGWDHTKSRQQGYITIKDLDADIFNLYQNGIAKGITTGWQNLDQLYTLRKGEMTLVTGTPSHGKGSFINHLFINAAVNHNFKIAMYTPENEPYQLHVSHLLELFTGKPFRKSDYTSDTPLNLVEMMAAKDFIEDHFFWIKPQQKSLDDILASVHLLFIKSKIDGFLLDPWNRIDHLRPPYLSETEYIAKCLEKISTFAKSNNICVWVVIHPAKLPREQGTNKTMKARAYDMMGSSHFYNMADNIIRVWRDAMNENKNIANLVEVMTLKIRFKMTGTIGAAWFDYDYRNGIFWEQHKGQGLTPQEILRSKNVKG